MMKRYAILAILLLATTILGGCVGTAAVMMEKRQVAELPPVNYRLHANQISYRSTGVYVTDFRMNELWFGSKIRVEDLMLSDFVKETMAGKIGVVADKKFAMQTINITRAEADAQFTTFWMGPWAKIILNADIAGSDRQSHKIEVTGRCRMVADNIQVFTQEQIAQVIRNAAGALVTALTDGKDHVAVGNNMECLTDGRTKIIDRED
jgi:hypothetical protein